jgi:membrane protein DedA with SNARE-associated domain
VTESTPQILSWISAHPGWALAILFLGAMLDAVFIIGVFVPAGLVLFGIGALVALGTVELWPAIAVATVGALCGDGLSFWLGRRYRERLFDWRWLRRNPELVSNGQRFFALHGGKGVIAARFLGPLRAILPAVAGAAGMPAWLFLLADSVAAVLWAIAYILPGVVFGASLGLAAEVAGRLAVLLLLLSLLIWLSIYMTRLILQTFSRHAEAWVGRMLDLSRRYRRLGRFGAALADPKQPETPVLLVLAVGLLLIGGLSLYLWSAPVLHTYPWPSDAAAFQWLRDLHTPYGLALATLFLHLGEWPVYLPVAIAVFASLLWQRKRRAAAHWIAALGFGLVLSLGLYAIPTLPAPYLLFGTPTPAGFSARDLVLATVIYGFIPVLLSTGRAPGLRVVFYGAATVILLLVVASRLYLGAQWLSQALILLAIGLVWTALLGLGYRRHRPELLARRAFLIPVLGAFLISACLQWRSDARNLPLETVAQPVMIVPAASWWSGEVNSLAVQRFDLAGRPKQPLNLQWAGRLDTLAERLDARGWQPPEPVRGINLLRWLSGSAPVGTLPVLPQVHAGMHQVLMRRLPVDAETQILLRLWPAGAALDSGEPLWLGHLSLQRARSLYWLWRYPVTEAQAVDAEMLLAPLDLAMVRSGGVLRLREVAP